MSVGERQQERHGDDAAEPRQDADHESIEDAQHHEEHRLRREQGQESRIDRLKHPDASPLDRQSIGPMRATTVAIYSNRESKASSPKHQDAHLAAPATPASIWATQPEPGSRT